MYSSIKHSLAALLLLALVVSVNAQEKPADATASTDAAAPAITLTSIAERASLTDKLIDELRLSLDDLPSTTTDSEQLTTARADVNKLEQESKALQEEANPSTEQLRTLQSRWQFLIDDIGSHISTYKTRTQSLETSLQKLATEKENWQKIATEIDANTALKEATSSRITSLAAIDTLQKRLSAPLQDLLDRKKNWQELIDRAQASQKQLKDRESTLKKDLLSTASQPLWQLQADEFRMNANTREVLHQQFVNAREYLQHYPILGSILSVLFFGTLLLIWRLRVRQRHEDSQHMGIGLKLPLLKRPFSTAIALAAGFGLISYPNQPQLISSAFSILLIIPVARLGMEHIAKPLRPLAWLVSIFFVINNLSVFTEAIPGLERLWFVACAIISAAACVHMLNTIKPEEAGRWKWLRSGCWLTLAVALVSMTAGLIGYANLAKMLITAAANAMYAGLCVFVVVGVITDIAVGVLYLGASSQNLLIARNRQMIIKRVKSTSLFIGVLIWLYFSLDQFLLFEPLWNTVVAILTKPLTLGKLSITLGDVLSIVVTIWLSYKISQLLRFIFLEDIAPRAKLARGVPDAVSTLMHYVIILIGFMMAMSVAGIDMSKLAIMAGALGVGIGIGLQDVVNNFSSGLIILFEQNIKQGDLIQSGTISGRVVKTGLRSSIVRTGDGAEVIIPNGQLASSQVINWTHSTQQRRLTLPVSVAYGSDPDLVLASLVEIAKEDHETLDDPAPAAYFTTFGANSLDAELRAWVRNSDNLSVVQTRLFISIIKRFEALGIEMPFPQQDVYVKSWPETPPKSPPLIKPDDA